ncbi:MAG: TrmH family RNA methyltransferase [Eggerthellaceae bacterium]|jgi:tRNA G18 (ribose-2'-O)-methylase SpoU
MSIERVDNLDDERLKAYVSLTDLELRNRLEPEQGVFIAESGKVITRAFKAGFEPLSLLMEDKWLDSLAPLIEKMTEEKPELPVFLADHKTLEKLTGYEVTRGALGAFRRKPLAKVAELTRDARRIAVLENITNHTNVGAIFRSAAGLGVDAVLISPGCYDPLYRRALRVSMGTVCQIPWTRIGTDAANWAQEGIETLKELGFTTLALTLSDRAIPLDTPFLAQERKLAIVLGSEGDGLSKEAEEACDYWVRIPMAHNVDSLNVAAASAVAFWELRQRNEASGQ